MNIIYELAKYPFTAYAIRIILAGICGFAIGLERSLNQKSAGVRTHVVVCCASALFMIVSIYGFGNPPAADGIRGADPARIAAQVVTGISFLGAGMIFKDGDAIKGLTTAAGVWSTAAIGLAIGAGMYGISIFVTAVLVIFMVIMHKFPIGADSTIDYKLNITVTGEDDFYPVISDMTSQINSQISKIKISRNNDGTITYKLLIRTNKIPDTNFLSTFMAQNPRIRDISGTAI